MSSVSRGVRNVLRNKARTIVVILIIGLSIGVFLSMSIVNSNISQNTVSIAENLDTTITIRPAGSYGFMSTETMNESMLTTVESVEHVDSIQKLVFYTETSGTSVMGRPGRNLIQGLDPSEDLILFSGGVISITSGRTLDLDDAGEPVAIIGSEYSSSNGVNVGSHIYLNGTASVEVVGVFTTGNRLGDSTVIAPYEVVKDAYAIDGISMVYLTVDNVGDMDSTIEVLKNELGSDYDVVPLSTMMGEAATALQDSINTIAANSEMGSSIALVTAALVMTFVMILITRERTKEIGVLKAIGFKNSKIVKQFFTESMALASVGFVVGVLLAVLAGPYIANMLLGVSGTTTATSGRGFSTSGESLLASTEFTLGADLLIYTLALAIILGVIGSLYPIMKAMRLKPAEALRYE